MKRLYRSDSDKMIAGVCSGIAEYIHIDPTIIRLLWVVFTCITIGWGILAYLIAAIVIPRESEIKTEKKEPAKTKTKTTSDGKIEVEATSVEVEEEKKEE